MRRHRGHVPAMPSSCPMPETTPSILPRKWRAAEPHSSSSPSSRRSRPRRLPNAAHPADRRTFCSPTRCGRWSKASNASTSPAGRRGVRAGSRTAALVGVGAWVKDDAAAALAELPNAARKLRIAAQEKAREPANPIGHVREAAAELNRAAAEAVGTTPQPRPGAAARARTAPSGLEAWAPRSRRDSSTHCRSSDWPRCSRSSCSRPAIRFAASSCASRGRRSPRGASPWRSWTRSTSRCSATARDARHQRADRDRSVGAFWRSASIARRCGERSPACFT